MPKSIYKSTNSLQNVILLLLFVIGLFVLYRYVKTIETETKMLHNHVIELTEKIQNLSTCNNPKINVVDTVSTKSYDNFKNKEETFVNQYDENDDMSIQSEDITNMLKKVMCGDSFQEDDDAIVDNIIIDIKQEEEDEILTSMVIEDITETESENNYTECSNKSNVLNIDDSDKKSQNEVIKETLMKKTNEELKGMLKEKQLQIKGSKQELVERLMSNM
jgi:hypothetical protein